MPQSRPKRKPRPEQLAEEIKAKVLDEVRFLKALVDKPRETGALAPSGPALAERMASFIDPASPLPVVELGPGTGAVTRALLDRGLPPERLYAIEYSADFCAHLKRRFPGVHVVHGDAYALRRTLGSHVHGPFQAIVSSLPLLNRPMTARRQVIDEALGLLAPGAPFVQFSYSLVPPVGADQGRFLVDKTNWVVLNLPPARVWTYRRPGH